MSYRSRLRLNVAVLVAAILAVTAWFVLRTREPVYQGKPLSTWLKDFDFASTVPRGATARQALCQMGTNSLPTLVYYLGYRDSPLKQRIALFIWQHHLWSDLMDDATVWQRRAAFALGELGPLADPALPAMAEAVNKSMAAEEVINALVKMLPKSLSVLTNVMATGASHVVREKAAVALVAGFSYPELVLTTLTALTNALQSGDFTAQTGALRALGRAPGQSTLIVPVLIRTMGDQSLHPSVRLIAAEALGGWHTQAEVVVPAFIAALSDTDVMVRCSAAKALGQFGEQADSAVPELSRLIDQDDTREVRESAAQAMEAIGNAGSRRRGE